MIKLSIGAAGRVAPAIAPAGSSESRRRGRKVSRAAPMLNVANVDGTGPLAFAILAGAFLGASVASARRRCFDGLHPERYGLFAN